MVKFSGFIHRVDSARTGPFDFRRSCLFEFRSHCHRCLTTLRRSLHTNLLCCALSREAVMTNFIVFGMTKLRIEPGLPASEAYTLTSHLSGCHGCSSLQSFVLQVSVFPWFQEDILRKNSVSRHTSFDVRLYLIEKHDQAIISAKVCQTLMSAV